MDDSHATPPRGLSRRPVFWIVFAILSLASAAFAWRYFPQAIPLLNLDVRMTREQADVEAAALAEKLKLEPADGRRAVRFAHDGAVQNFVELEGGGKAAFAALLKGNLYSPYWWAVRIFKPGETAEALLRFRPDGSPYGFRQGVAESAQGAALGADAARAIAEEAAKRDWQMDFSRYNFLEQSQQARPSGRIDHAFVYERTQEQLGEGRFRLRLVVSGDRFTELTHYVHVPEAFGRRYEELRASNNTIARVASLAAGALYGIGGCVLGVLWLLRRRWLVWRPALAAGMIVAALGALAALANAPAAWSGYDTAQSTSTFWSQQIGSAALLFVGGGLALALVFMAAESLSRFAFPTHPQLWRLWSAQGAPTWSVLGRTLGGYLFVPIELALVAAFYYITNRYFGWWQPSESLTNPDVLASSVPGLAPIAMSLQAGFMEESLFRAVPLSIAALIGARLGHRGTAVGIALVLQALVFGAAHANYPGFPAYSRLVELIIPSILWGLIFLRFGLLSTALLHALFDLCLFSIPLFLIQGPGSVANQALVIGAALVPLAIVLLQRSRSGAWAELPSTLRNGTWRPIEARIAAASARTRAAAGIWTARVQRLLPALGLAGLAAMIAFGDFSADAPTLNVSRADAENAADGALREKGVTLGPEWVRSSSVRLANADPASWQWHKFVWREGGPSVYASLIGGWLAPPLWEVRYARFTGVDVAERAEEWHVTIGPDGKPRQVRHDLPEARPGERISREDAGALARSELQRRFGVDAQRLREVGAEQRERPARRDWTFTFTDPQVDVGKGGEARAVVNLAGREPVLSGRYVFVPEEWQREERTREGRLTAAKIGFAILSFVAAIGALVLLVLAWSRGRFDRRAFWLAGSIVLAASVLSAIDQWPSIAMNLKTAEPLVQQIGVYAAAILLGLLSFALFAGLLAGVASRAVRIHSEPGLTLTQLWWRGMWAGFFALGVDLMVSGLAPDLAPNWSSYRAENSWLPTLEVVTSVVSSGLFAIAAGIVVLDWLDRLTAGWTRHRVLVFVVLALIGAATTAFKSEDWAAVVAAGIMDGAVTTFLFATVLRFDLRIVPAFVAVPMVARLTAEMLEKRTSEAYTLGAVGIVTALVLAWLATRYLLARSGEASNAETAVPARLPTSAAPPSA